MKHLVRVGEEASAEIAEAALWYERGRPGLGDAFITEVDAAVGRIGDNPATGA